MIRVVVLVMLLSACTTQQVRVAYHAFNAADVGTTLYGLDHGCSEGNPLLGDSPSDATVVAFGLAQSGLAELVCGNAGDEERICWVAFTVVKVLATGWNASQIARECH